MVSGTSLSCKKHKENYKFNASGTTAGGQLPAT